MSARDFHRFLSCLNPLGGDENRVLTRASLQRGLARQFECECINEVALTHMDIFQIASNWSLLGPICRGGLMAGGVFGAFAIIGHSLDVRLVIRDELMMFWDMEQALVLALPEEVHTEEVPKERHAELGRVDSLERFDCDSEDEGASSPGGSHFKGKIAAREQKPKANAEAIITLQAKLDAQLAEMA